MDLSKFNQKLLESVDVGLAILSAENGELVFGNRRYLEWFPGTVGVVNRPARYHSRNRRIENAGAPG